MRRRLLLLNLALAALIALAGWRIREQWLAENAHERAVLQQAPRTVPPPPISPVPAPKPLTASSYGEIAQKMLFAKDRNSVVVVEAPKVVPPKPMPPLPVFYGVMNMPSGPVALMSEKPNTRHLGIHVGDTLGEFKILALNTQRIELEWDGKKISKNVSELIDRGAQNPAAAPAPAANAPAPAGPPTAPTPQPAVSAIPAEAVPTDEGSFRGKDKDGKTWLYRQTPFGISKVEDKGAAPAQPK